MKLGVAVGTNDPWRFFDEVFRDLQTHYDVDTFAFRETKVPFLRERINRIRFYRQMNAFLACHDTVFFEWASNLLAAATKLPKRCRIVTRLHRYELFEWASKVNWDTVDVVILVSEAMKRRFVERFANHARKTVVLPVGVSTELFKPVARSFAGDIGTLCNLTPRKRVYELILAFHELTRNQEKLRLHIGGACDPQHMDYFAAMQDLVRKLGIQDNVTFYGEVKSPWEWYGKVDIFVSNSYSEGLQVAPMEAMACGCQTLSHHWEGAEELVPNENLFLGDDELREKILTYCAKPEAEKRMCREQMRAIACQRFDQEVIKARIRVIIEGSSGGND